VSALAKKGFENIFYNRETIPFIRISPLAEILELRKELQ